MINKAKELVLLLIENKMTISCAESCTGGMVSELITSVNGSSEVLKSSYVTYSIEEKQRLLEIEPDIISDYGVVSPETAYRMSCGVRRQSKCDIGIGITGIAGPTGEEPGNPVGTVYISVAGSKGVCTRRYHFNGTRNIVRRLASYEAIRLTCDLLSEGVL